MSCYLRSAVISCLLVAALLLQPAEAANVFVTVYDGVEVDGSVLKIDESGTVTTYASGFEQPKGLAFGPDSALYVLDGGNVYRVDGSGASTLFATAPSPYNSEGLAVDAAGFVYASGATSALDPVIWKFSPAGLLVDTWSLNGFGPVMGLTFSASGQLYAAATYSDSIVRFSPTGVAEAYGSGVTNPAGIAFAADGRLYVSGADASMQPTLSVMGVDGIGVVPLLLIANNDIQAGGVAVDPEGILFTALGTFCGCDNAVLRTEEMATTEFKQLADNQYAYYVTTQAVPEPGTWAMLAVGAVVVGVATRRRRRSA